MFFFALLVFTIAAISDGLDGLIARYFKQHTILGAYLDPIADKLLLISAFVSLAVLKLLPGWLTVIVLSRDILILLGIAVFSIAEISFEIKPTLTGKWTTVTQLATIFLVLLNPDIPEALLIKQTLYWVAAGLTTLSGLQYIYIGMNIIQGTTNHQ